MNQDRSRRGRLRSILVSLCFAASSTQAELYEQDFDVADTNNLGDGTAMAGDATVTGNVLRLTTNTNSNNQTVAYSHSHSRAYRPSTALWVYSQTGCHGHKRKIL